MIYTKGDYVLYEEHYYSEYDDEYLYGYTLFYKGREAIHAGSCSGKVTLDEWIEQHQKINNL